MAILTKSQRLVVGVVALLVVDIIWVTSSELTKYIFKNEDFSKPFFSTYIKTTMFMIYLFGFIIWKPWRDQCFHRPVYTVSKYFSQLYNAFIVLILPLLSDSTWVPIRFHDGGDKGSGNESDDSVAARGLKSVRFSKLTEVRQLSDAQADDALLARLSYMASVRAQEAALREATKLSVKQVAKVALLFCIPWFLGNLSYQEALLDTEAGIVNVLSCSSALFTLILAAMFPSNTGDKFSLSKFLAVVVSMGGVVLISASDQQRIKNYFPPGAMWSIAGAVFYAAYIVMLRRKVNTEEKLDIPMFFGFVGLFNLLIIWPGFFLLHYTKVEKFQWPTYHQWLLLIVNGLIGTVLSELLWLWGCFLTSSLIATLSISLTIPLTVLFDMVLKKVKYPNLFFFGMMPMFLSFFAVTLLAHYDNWDPVTEYLHKLVSWICCRKKPNIR
ncbi:solute carrier family 35 member F5-like [Limulus polyphemus]|uniref:Solute carrier family 35 member F5 n=1 Tax=Limulus polyphemus TaxID=6850 RepID=A0ABM1STP1_LIMPO|nr:solute carrier family 35 member F5-like [Limulus polyphemus]